MRRTIIYILVSALAAAALFPVGAQDRRDTLALEWADSLTNEYLDTVNVKRKAAINDYSMIGVYYGPSLASTSFNPTKNGEMVFRPVNYGIVWTKYGKMFGYMPYFGVQLSFGYGQDGYRIKVPKTGWPQVVDGYIAAKYEYLEAAAMGHMHIDIGNNFKLMANIGLYGGYRLSIEREMAEGYEQHMFNVTDSYKPAEPEYDMNGRTYDYIIANHLNEFYPFEYRWEYGIKGGAGFGLIFDPVEIHINAMLRYGFGSLYQPDYYSREYYRFAYPLDVVITAGIHFQLTKRRGKTNKQLKQEARALVYGKNTSAANNAKIDFNEDTLSQGR